MLHMKSVHSQQGGSLKARFTCHFDDCKATFFHHKDLIGHYKQHNVQLSEFLWEQSFNSKKSIIKTLSFGNRDIGVS